MRFYKFDSRGPMFLNRGTGTPGAVAANEGRIFYEDGGEEIFYADAAAWIRMYSENNLSTLVTDLNVTGAWLRKDQDDVTAFRLTINDGVIGDIRATDGTKVLENGSDGTDATFIGDIIATDGTKVLENGSDGTDATFEGNVLSDNGVRCLFNGATPANSTFAGTANAAKYS